MVLTNIPIGHWVDLRKLNKSSVIVDAGACVGEFVEGVRRIPKLNKCKIIAIEPDKNNIAEMRTKGIPVIEGVLVGRGLPDKINFYYNNNADAGNILYPTDNHYSVQTITLDDLFQLTPKIDFMKIDIEGAEKGLIETMTQEDANKIDQISLELHYNLHDRLLKKLRKLGYKTLRFSYRETYLYK